MKYLDRFVQYLNESNDYDDLSMDELKEMLLPISDLEIEYTIEPPKVMTSGEFSGRKYVNIRFKNDFKTGEFGGYTNQIVDNRFWDFLEELTTLRHRLESDFVSITNNWTNYITLTFVQMSKVEEDDLFKLRKLSNEMGLILNSAKSMFSYSIVRELDEKNTKLIVRCGGTLTEQRYTDRKWNGLFRDIDFSQFNVSKDVSDGYARITITVK